MLGRGQGGGEKGGPRAAHQVFDKWKNKKEGGLERLLACMSIGGAWEARRHGEMPSGGR